NARSIPRFTTLAPLTFGVYLTHPVFLDIAKRTGAYLPTSGTAWQTPLAAIVIFVLSVVFVRVLRQMPGGTRITCINLSCQRPAHGHTLTILPVATLDTMRQRRRCQMVRFPRLWVALWILVGFVFIGNSHADIPPPALGEPTVVHAHLQLEDINDIQLSTGTYDITALLTLRWKDERQAFSRSDGSTRPAVWMGSRAAKRLEAIWHPTLDITSEKGLTTN